MILTSKHEVLTKFKNTNKMKIKIDKGTDLGEHYEHAPLMFAIELIRAHYITNYQFDKDENLLLIDEENNGERVCELLDKCKTKYTKLS